MKTKKYLLAGALILSLSTPVLAQNDGYKVALNPIISAIEAAPTDLNAGKDLIKEYIKTYKKDEQALTALGNVFLAQRNFTEAMKIANSIVTNKKMNGTLGYLLLGDIVALQDSVGNAGSAAQHYATAISLDPHNVAAYERYAKVYRHVNSQVSIQKLEELRQVEPNYPVEATAAEIMLGDGKFAEALSWFDKANRANLTEDNFYKYSYTAYVLRKYDKAMEIVEAGLQRFPSSEYLSRVGMMSSVEKGDFTAALNFANKMFSGPGKKVANDHAIYGKALAGNKEYDKAIENLNKALDMDKKNLEPMKTIAEVYIAQGDVENALKVQMDYLSKNQNANSNDWAKLAQAWIEKAETETDRAVKNTYLDKAIAIYDQMVVKFPSISDWIWSNQANVAQMKNDADKVADIYKKIAAYEEAKPQLDDEAKAYLEQVYYGLGYYYSKLNNQEMAKQYFNKVLTVNPNNENAKKALGL
ncbi:tetratricopeptide repeat protein [Prevotella aurantiaca]|uniref:tetratricopeptide repeat protein n=1 Tax=Prevotella aurantiaca TaxID=596085 RepID=UPI0028DCA24E|nr:tetratricopeptide repeat protein [Prevotella aurantiaca]